MSVVDSILYRARTQPDAPALIHGDRTLTYRELAFAVARMAAHLKTLSLQSGDRIGLCLKDNPLHIVALLAVARMGGVAVPLDWRAPPAETGRNASRLGLNSILTEPDARTAVDCRLIVLDAAWNETVAAPEPMEPARRDWNDPFVIVSSSGSTGAPKFTLLTHLQFHFQMAGMLELNPLAGRHTVLCPLPLVFAAGRSNCILHLLRGDCIILYPSLLAPEEYVEAAKAQGATIGLLVPTLLRRLLAIRGPEPLLPGLAALIVSSAPLDAEEKRHAQSKLSPNFYQRYGTTETQTLAMLHPVDIARKADSVGQCHSLGEIEIVDDDDRPLADGAVGHLRFRGAGLASPIPGDTSEASYRGGWYYPGDIARFDEFGYLFLHGRSSEVIVRNAVKIYPVEIEEALREHPAIVDAAVIGRPAADKEEEVVAFVVARRQLPAGELIAHCRSRLSANKVPRQIFFLADLPKTSSGKIDKTALAAPRN